MKLVLVRHGQAEPYRPEDAERALTENGVAQARQAGAWLQGALAGEQGAATLVASPHRRAQETAIAFNVFLRLPLLTLEAITPDADPRRALSALEAVAGDGSIVMISHMPLVAALESWLVEGVLSGGSPFALAEVRVLELATLAPGVATRIDTFLPSEAWPR